MRTKTRRLLSFVLALVMLVSSGCISAFAITESDEQTLTISASNVTVEKSSDPQTVYVNLYMDKDAEISNFGTKINITDDAGLGVVFAGGATIPNDTMVKTINLSANGTTGGVTASDDAGQHHMALDEEIGGYVLATIPLSVPADAVGSVTVNFTELNAADWDNANGYALYSTTATATITISEPKVEGYTAAFSTSASNNEVVSESGFDVYVTVSHSSDTVFNAGEIKLSYDSTKLNPDADALNALVEAKTLSAYKNEGGVLTLEDFGADKGLDYVYAIPFTAEAVTAEQTTEIELTDAAFIHKENADKSNLIDATITPETLTVTIKVAMVDVTLTDDKGNTTTTTTQRGQDYTFAPNDADNYDYTDVTATVERVEVSVTDNGDGTFTIAGADVTGNIVLNYKKTAKTYNVTFEGSAKDEITDGAANATYNVDYTFTMPSVDGWAYSLGSITIDGVAYTGYTVADSVYTIPGAAITGDIVITVNKSSTEASVAVEGSGAGAAGGYDATADLNKPYTLTIVPETGYTYTVTAKMGGADTTVVDNGDNTYTIANVTGNIVFTVTATLDVTSVNVTQYVQVNNVSVWLVTYDGELIDGKVPTYNVNTMFWSDKYDAYCWLEIADTLSVDDAKALVNAKEGSSTDVDYGMDINGTGVTDAADAQMVWNMYNAVYGDFDTVTMEQFLAADQNATSTNTDAWKLTVEDALVIVTAIMNGNATV